MVGTRFWHRISFASVMALLSAACSTPSTALAIVWANQHASAPTAQTGPMQHVGRLLYSRFAVFGGSCIWIGDRWVLTARHGVKDWSSSSLTVDFPAHGTQRYTVRTIHFPPDQNVDLAILELSEALPFDKPTLLSARVIKPKALIRVGGFGNYGTAGKISGTNRFHWGTNMLDSADQHSARFSMSEASAGALREALPALFDSGSPVFLTANNSETLVGIVVRVSNRMAPKVGDRATMTCLSSQAMWIKQTATGVLWAE